MGAVQVGMLRALLEHDIRPDLILGCSVGALNGAGLAEDPSLAGVAQLERCWHNVDAREIMPRSRLPHALALARRGESIQPAVGLRQMLLRTFHARTFEQLRLPFECVATDVEDATEAWFSEGDLVDAVMASAAMPALYPTVVLGGRRYIDGGVVNDVPLSRAVEQGAGRLYVLEAGSFSRSWAAPRRPIDAVVHAYSMARQHRFAKDLAAVPDHIELHLLPYGVPPQEMPLRFDDFTRTKELIDNAYRASDAYLRGIVAPSAAGPSSGWADWADV
jgi:NTE family protein